MIRKIVTVLILVPLALAIVVFAVANRAPVLIAFDPFGAQPPMFAFAAPLFLVLSPFYFLWWRPGVALAHLAFSVTIALLLIEVLIMEFRKIPFTCSYPPGKANVSILWVGYWVAFLVYAFAITQLTRCLLDDPSVTGVVKTIVLLVTVWAIWALTTWVTTYFDPNSVPTRYVLVGVMLVSMLMFASLPQNGGWWGFGVALPVVVIQFGWPIVVLSRIDRQDRLWTNFVRTFRKLRLCILKTARSSPK